MSDYGYGYGYGCDCDYGFGNGFSFGHALSPQLPKDMPTNGQYRRGNCDGAMPLVGTFIGHGRARLKQH